MAVLAEHVDELRPEPSGAADDHDLHGLTTFVMCRSRALRSALETVPHGGLRRAAPIARPQDRKHRAITSRPLRVADPIGCPVLIANRTPCSLPETPSAPNNAPATRCEGLATPST